MNKLKTAGPNWSCIWEPKRSSMEVLVSTLAVQDGDCFVFFAYDKNWPGVYKFDGSRVIKECEKQANGNILVYKIPLAWLNKYLDEIPERFIPVVEQENKAAKAYYERKRKKQ